MAIPNQDPPSRAACRRGSAGGSVAQRLRRAMTRERLVPAAGWLLSVLLALALIASARWNALQFAALTLLFGAPWALVWLLSSRRERASGGVAAPDAVDSDWVALVAPMTGYSVSINDAQRRLLWVNESFTRLTGYTAGEAIGQYPSDLLYFDGTDAATVARVRESFAAARTASSSPANRHHDEAAGVAACRCPRFTQ
jgi:PAS domain-containing protein